MSQIGETSPSFSPVTDSDRFSLQVCLEFAKKLLATAVGTSVLHCTKVYTPANYSAALTKMISIIY